MDQVKRKLDRLVSQTRDTVETASEAKREVQALKAHVEAGHSLICDKLKTMHKGGSMSGLVYPSGSDFGHQLPDFIKGKVASYEAAAKSYPEDSPLRDPCAVALYNEHTRLTFKLASDHFKGQHMDVAEKMRRLNSVIFKANPGDGLQEDTTTEGGHFVPTLVANEVQRIVLDSSQVFSRCRQVPLQTKVTNLPSETTGCVTNWVSEEGTLSGGEPIFGQVTLTANKLAGRGTVSIEMLEDSNVAVLPYLQTIFAESIAGESDFQVVEGTTPFTGINTAADINTIAAYSTTGSADPSYPLLVQAFIAGGEASTRNNGFWAMSPGVFGNVCAMVDSNGQPIVKFGDAAGAMPMSIFGRPVVVTNRATTGTSAATGGTEVVGRIYFISPDHALAGVRQGLRWDITDAVNWATYRMDCRLVGRYAFAVSRGAAHAQVTKVNVLD